MRYLMAAAGMMMLAGCSTPANKTTDAVPNAAPAMAAPAAQTAQEPDSCVSPGLPDISVDFDTVAAAEDRSRSMRDLTSAEDEKRNVEVLGELDVKISFDVHFDGKGWQLSNGSNCVYLSKASVAIHWRNSINLASEMIPDTCADKSVRRSLTEVIGEQHGYQPGVEQKVKDALREASHNTIIDASLENARQRLLDSFGKTVNAVVKPEADRYFQKLKGLEKVGLLDKIATQCDDQATQKLLEAAAKP